MTTYDYTDDTLIQPTAASLEQWLGWRSVYAYNCEDFGPDSPLDRALDREMVLTRPLRVALNPSLPAAAYDDAL